MRVKKKLQINAILTIGFALVIGLSVYWTMNKANKENNTQRLAYNVVKAIVELNIVTYEYLLHHEEWSVTQWRLKYNSIKEFLKNIQFDGQKKMTLQNTLRQRLENINTLFAKLISNYDKRGSLREEKLILFDELQERLTSRVIVQSHDMVSKVSQLHKITQAAVDKIHRDITLLVIIFALILGLLISAISYFTNRGLASSIDKLLKGSQVIGSGNLDFKVCLESNDEIGQLSIAFDQMVENLKRVMTSRDDLEKEIKERKHAEEELKKYQEILREMNDGFVIINPQGTLLEINDSFTKMTGWTKEDLIGTKPPYKFWRKKDVTSIMKRLSDLQDKGQSVNAFEQILQKKDGGEVPGLVNSTILYDSNSKPKYFFGIFRDITDIKQAEESLRKESHDLAERVKELNCLYGISALVEIPGISLDEILQGTVDLIPQSFQFPEITCARLIMNGLIFSTNNFNETIWKLTESIMTDGKPTGTVEVYYLEEKPGMKAPFLKEERDLINAVAGQLGRIVDHKLDEDALKESHDELESRVEERTSELVLINEKLLKEIVDRKRIEEVLRESEERYRAIFEQAADSIVIVDPNTGMMSDFNDKACKSLGYTRQEFAKLKVSYFEASESDQEIEKHLEKIRRRIRNEGSDEFSTKHRRKDGEIRDIVVNTEVISVHGKKFIQAIWRDVTDRKRADEQIKASLREKEVLLKEVHHRVKNNLQIISSLIDMSRRRTNNREAVDLLSETEAKIHTMALIHTQLYQSNRFDQIDMQSHIRDFITYISQLYGAKKNITPVINSSDVILSVTQAIPFALAMNELIANVFRHAFEEGKGGILEVSMEQSSDDTISVKVKDDGIGIPEEVDINETETLGLKLVRNLVLKQLKGKYKIERNNGTEVFIEFKVSKEETKHA